MSVAPVHSAAAHPVVPSVAFTVVLGALLVGLGLWFVGVLALMIYFLCSSKGRDTSGPRGPPSSNGQQPPAVAVEVEAAAPMEVDQLAPLVCTYLRADGWREATCGVCLSELADGEVLRLRVMLACIHYFHAACVGEWLRLHATCPLCRAPVAAGHRLR